MPTLPQDIDYGKRPSLDSSRLDRPTGANAALADSVVVAADKFQAVMAERKTKENRLNYALARNEIQQLAIEEQAKLAEDLDWDTHDKRYSEGFKTGAEAIGQRYRLSGSDRQLLDAETGLIHTQGLVQVAARSRLLEVKEARGNYIEGKAAAKASIILADPGARNRIVLGQLDAIDAMVEAGSMDEDEAAIEREEMTQDFALSSLLAMPAEERYRQLRDSLAYRKGYGSSLGEYSDSFIRASTATGLPADLLHAVASRESSLDPSVVNKESGATGIMQLRAGTASDLGVTDRTDADQSIQGGAKYLAEQFERFDDIEAALAAYNWGPKNVASAMKEHGDDWLAHAPEETQDYVAALADVWVSGGDKEIVTKGKFDSGEGPLSADDIRAGRGTNRIADFLHADTAAKMLEAAAKEDKTNKQREAAQLGANEAWARFPEDDAARTKWLRDNLSGTVQKLAEQDSRQRNADEVRAKEQASTAKFEGHSNQMVHEGLRLKDIPTEELREMTPYHQDQLRLLSERLSYSEQFPAVTVRTRPKVPLVGMSQQGWNEMPSYGKGSRAEANLETAEYYNAFTEQDHDAMVAEQKLLLAAQGELILTGDLAPGVMVTKALEGMQFTVDSDSDDEKLNGIKARLEAELRQRILQQQNATSPRQELDEKAKNKILADLLSPMAFTDGSAPWYTFGFGDDERKRVHLMTAAQLEGAYVSMEKANANTMTYEGQELNVQQILEKMASEASPSILEITPHNMSRAAFAFLNNIGTTPAEERDEVLRRLRGE